MEKSELIKLRRSANIILQKYPDRIPVVLKNNKRAPVEGLKKLKYLVPRDITVAEFMENIRKGVSVSSNEAIFIYVNNNIPTATKLMGDIYEEFKDETLYLVMDICHENTFG